MTVFQNEGKDIFYGGAVTHGNYFSAGNHDFPGYRFAQLKDTLDHFTRLTIDEAVFLTHIDDGLYLLFQLSQPLFPCGS